MQAYRVSGVAPFGSQRQKFSIDLVADSTDTRTLLLFHHGSRHKPTRRSISIESISEIDPRTSTEPRVTNAFRDEIAAAGGLIAPVSEESENNDGF